MWNVAVAGAVEVPAANVRVGELLGEQAPAALTRGHRGDAPALVLERQQVDLQGVARLCARDGDGAGHRVALGFDRFEVSDGGFRRELAVVGVTAVERDDGAGFDGERGLVGRAPRVVAVVLREVVVWVGSTVDGDAAVGHGSGWARRGHNPPRCGTGRSVAAS